MNYSFVDFVFFVTRVLPLRKLFPWFSYNEMLCVLFKTTIMETYPACNMSKHPQINSDWDQCYLQLGLILMHLRRHEDLIFSVTWSECLLRWVDLFWGSPWCPHFPHCCFDILLVLLNTDLVSWNTAEWWLVNRINMWQSFICNQCKSVL